jgi:hypothetical protein
MKDASGFQTGTVICIVAQTAPAPARTWRGARCGVPTPPALAALNIAASCVQKPVAAVTLPALLVFTLNSHCPTGRSQLPRASFTPALTCLIVFDSARARNQSRSVCWHICCSLSRQS